MARKAREQRLGEIERAKRRGRRTAKKLQMVIKKAVEQGKHFLDIADSWKQTERALFQKGVGMYRGLARIEYCDTTNLTPEFVDSQPLSALRTAAVNVGVYTQGQGAEASAAATRSRLHMFIKYG